MELLRGVGLPHVYLVGGMHKSGNGEAQQVSYDDLDGLYFALSRAVATRQSELSANELRFLRKRLDMSQADLAELMGKTNQAVAKWEKGQLPVPRAEATLVRLLWLNTFAPAIALRVLDHLRSPRDSARCFAYVLVFDGNNWTADESRARIVSQQIAMTGAAKIIDSVRYTTAAGPAKVFATSAADTTKITTTS